MTGCSAPPLWHCRRDRNIAALRPRLHAPSRPRSSDLRAYHRHLLVLPHLGRQAEQHRGPIRAIRTDWRVQCQHAPRWIRNGMRVDEEQ